MAGRFMFDEIGNVPTAPDAPQESVPLDALVVRSGAARDASQAADEAREDVARLQRLVAGNASFKDRLYGYANRGPGNVEDRSDQPPYEPPNWLDRPIREFSKQSLEREKQRQRERELVIEMSRSQLARDAGLLDIDGDRISAAKQFHDAWDAR